MVQLVDSKMLGFVVQNQLEKSGKIIIDKCLGQSISQHVTTRLIAHQETVLGNVRPYEPNFVLNVFGLVRNPNVTHHINASMVILQDPTRTLKSDVQLALQRRLGTTS